MNLYKVIKIALVSNAFFDMPLKNKKASYFIAMILLIGGTTIEKLILKSSPMILFLIINLIIIFLIFDNSIKNKLKIYILSYFIIESTDVIFYTMTFLITKKNILEMIGYNNAMIDNLCTTPSVLLWIGVHMILKRKNIKKINIEMGNYWVFLFAVVFATLQLGFVTFGLGSGLFDNDNKKIYYFIGLLLMIGSSLSLILSYLYAYRLSQIRVLQESELYLMNQRNQMNKDYYLSLVKNEEETRMYQHDIRHILRLVRNAIEVGRGDEAVGIIDELLEKSYSTQKIIYSQNKIVDATIYGILGENSDDGIQFSYKGVLPTELGVSDIDLCAVLSNLLENAREAVLKCSQHREIKMLASKQGNVIIFDIYNSTINDGLNLNTTKNNERHGFGIKNVNRIVEKYNGEMEINFEEGMFHVKVILLGEVKKIHLL